MYQIKINLDQTHPSVIQALTDRQDMHSNIQQFFGCQRADANVLYRIYQDKTVYIYSDKKPVASDMNGMTVEYVREVDLNKLCQEGNRLKFSIDTTPYKKMQREIDGKKKGKRVTLTKPEERLNWLKRKGAISGFEIENVVESGYSFVTTQRKENGIEYRSYQYFGILTVTDAEAFKNTIVKGIGAGKAYGLGMLMIAC